MFNIHRSIVFAQKQQGRRELDLQVVSKTAERKIQGTVTHHNIYEEILSEEIGLTLRGVQ
jgi:hypothetical protein